MKVMDFHATIDPQLDITRVHQEFEKAGIYEAVNIVDFVEDDLDAAIDQADSSGRIRPVIMIPPQLRAAPEYLERSVKKGFVALKIHPQIHGFRINDPAIFPTILRAKELGIPVLVHTEPSWSRGPFFSDMRDAATLPYIFPDVKFVFYEGDPNIARWLMKKFHNLFIDTANFPGYSIEEIKPLFEWNLGDRIVYGTDFLIQKDKVISYHKQQQDILEKLKIAKTLKRKILEENWKGILKA